MCKHTHEGPGMCVSPYCTQDNLVSSEFQVWKQLQKLPDLQCHVLRIKFSDLDCTHNYCLPVLLCPGILGS